MIAVAVADPGVFAPVLRIEPEVDFRKIDPWGCEPNIHVHTDSCARRNVTVLGASGSVNHLKTQHVRRPVPVIVDACRGVAAGVHCLYDAAFSGGSIETQTLWVAIAFGLFAASADPFDTGLPS